MIVYGYPSIGGSNITRTEGKIGWMEWEKYKFDGTIDHGNSGGGAFDSNGKLIGMPYAVSSDNGVIGYIISSATISKFLSWKSYNKEKYTSPKLTEFVKYTKEIESAYKNVNSIKTKYVDIKNMGKAGFLFDYRFIDKNERVAVLIGCSKDSSWGKSTIQINEWELDNKDNSPLVSIKWGYLDAEKKYFSVDAMQLKETNGEKVVYTSIIQTAASNCAVTIIANDGLKKDKALYQKAIELAKNVKFLSPTPLATSYNSPFFSAQTIPKNVYIAEGTIIDNSVILPNIYFELWKDYSTADSIEIGTYANRDEYMNMFAEEGGYYKSSDYSFDAFYNRYKTPNDSRIIEEVVIKSKNNKKMILTVMNLAQWNNDQNIQKTRVLMFYPFQDTLGKYRSYTLRFDFASQDRTYVQEIRSFLEAMELPGNSAFTN